MDIDEISKIYDRLSAIQCSVEARSIPDPKYIGEKIMECRACIDEVEKYFIQVNKEYSVLQCALNNSDVSYTIERDSLISSNPEIVGLPSLKDREAKANSLLKDKINEIKVYKNDLANLENLRETLKVKLKNLYGTNSDIKLQLRLMEAQLKLGTGSTDDLSEKPLMDELQKSVLGKDMWEGSKSSLKEEKILDPTVPIKPSDISGDAVLDNFKNILEKQADVASDNKSPKELKEIVEELGLNNSVSEKTVEINSIKNDASFDFNDLLKTFNIKDTPKEEVSLQINTVLIPGIALSPESSAEHIVNVPSEENKSDLEKTTDNINTVLTQEDTSDEEDPFKINGFEEDDYFTDQLTKNDISSEDKNPVIIDLDNILESVSQPNSKPGGDDTKKEATTINESSTKETQKAKDPDDISIDELLKRII